MTKLLTFTKSLIDDMIAVILSYIRNIQLCTYFLVSMNFHSSDTTKGYDSFGNDFLKVTFTLPPLLWYYNSSCSHWKASKALKHFHSGVQWCKISLEIIHRPSFSQESVKPPKFRPVFCTCFVGEQYPYGKKSEKQKLAGKVCLVPGSISIARRFLLSGEIYYVKNRYTVRASTTKETWL